MLTTNLRTELSKFCFTPDLQELLFRLKQPFHQRRWTLKGNKKMKKHNLIALFLMLAGLAGGALAQQYQQARQEDRNLIQRELRTRISADERRDYDVQIDRAETWYISRNESGIRGRARINSNRSNDWRVISFEGVIDVRRNIVNNLRWQYDNQYDRRDDRYGQQPPYGQQPQYGQQQTGVLRSGRYEIELVATRRMLSVSTDGRTVVQASGNGRLSQWDIEDAGNGYFYITSVSSGEAMTASGRGESGDTVVLARLRRGDQNQMWQIRQGPDNGYYFTTQRGKALDSPSSARSEGGRMQIYNSNGEANQRFILRSVDNYGGRDQNYNRDRDNRGRDRDQSFGGYGQQTGSVIWRGRVDDVTVLEIRDRTIRDRVVSGQPAQGVNFNFTSALPRNEVNVTVDKRRGRGEVRVVEQPSRRNGYTAIIEIRDSSGGSSDYEIEVRWN